MKNNTIGTNNINTTIGDVIDVTIIRAALRCINCSAWTAKHPGTTGKRVFKAHKAKKTVYTTVIPGPATGNVVVTLRSVKAAKAMTFATLDAAQTMLEKTMAKAGKAAILAEIQENGKVVYTTSANLDDESGKGLTPAEVLAGLINKAREEAAKREPTTDDERRSGVPADHPWAVSTWEKGSPVSVRYYPTEEAARRYYDGERMGLIARERKTVVRLRHYGVTLETTEALKGRVSKVVHIKAFKPGVHSMEEIPGGTSLLYGPVMNWLCEQTGLPAEKVIVKVEARVSGLDSEDEVRQHIAEMTAETWDRTVDDGLVVDGQKYAVFGHGTNSAKDGYCLLCPKGYEEDVRRWALNDPEAGWLRTNAKDAAYAGLRLPAVTSWASMGLPFGVQDVAIAETSVMRTMHTEDALYTAPDGSQKRGPMEFVQNSSDGMMIISVSMKWLESHLTGRKLKYAIKRYSKLAAHSGRLPVGKGYAQVAPIDGAQTFLRNLGVTEFGGRPVDDVVFFMDPTAFKGSFGANGSHVDLADYIRKAEGQQLLDDVGALLWAHGPAPKMTKISNQLVRTVLPMATPEELAEVMEIEDDYIKNVPISELIGGTVGAMAEAFGEIRALKAMRTKEREARKRLITEARRGEFHGLARNFPISCDPFAALAAWVGKEYKDIPVGCAVLRGANKIPGFYEGMEVILYRNPLTNLGAVVIVKLFSSYTALFAAMCPKREKEGRLYDLLTKQDGTLILSAADDAQTRMRADVDGDHVMMVINPVWVRIVERVLRDNPRPILLWDAPNATKCRYSREGMKRHYKGLVRTPNVGQHDDGISVLMGNHRLGDPLSNEELAAIGQFDFKFNTDVDSGKHGASVVDFIWTKLAAACRGAKLSFSVWANKAEKWAERSGRKHEARRSAPVSVFDHIRKHYEGFSAFVSVDQPTEEQLKDFYKKLQLPNAEKNPTMYGFAKKPAWRFFEYINGELAVEPSVVKFVDDELFDSDAAVELAKEEGCLVNWHDPDGRSHVFNGQRDEDGYPIEVEGKWVLHQTVSGFFNVVRARFDDELRECLLSNDADIRVRAGAIKAHIREEARAAIAEYAFSYGYTIRDAYNKIVRVMFSQGAWGNTKGAWKPNSFDLMWFSVVFAPELEEVLGCKEEEEVMGFDATIPE